MHLPRVGITAYRVDAHWGGVWQRTVAMIPQEYLDFVTAGGGVPVVLPVAGERADVAVGGVDAVILSGGPDVAPERYRAEMDALGETFDPVRDSWDFAVLRAALARDLPVLAICRGLQLLNVAYGGTLHQHLPNVVQSDAHRTSIGKFSENLVHAVAGSQLESIIGPGVTVPCHHHQAVAEIGSGLVLAASATDGVVEALEDPDREFVIGVQWHPEEGVDASLSRALVEAAIPLHVARRGA